tara:strand:+ start:153 stop:401 length:249 start_codon:yes stop_codon:yes gene_type:complete
MKNNLLSKFEGSKIDSLHHCKGGAITQTGNISGKDCKGKDFQNVTFTQVAGQPEGAGQMDYGQSVNQCDLEMVIRTIGVFFG